MGIDRGVAQPDWHAGGSGAAVLLPLRSEDGKVWGAGGANAADRRRLDAAGTGPAHLCLHSPHAADGARAANRAIANQRSALTDATGDSTFSRRRFELRKLGGLAVCLFDGGVGFFRLADLPGPDLYRLPVSPARA